MKHLMSFNETKKSLTIQDVFDRIKEIENAKYVMIKGKKVPLTDEVKRNYISTLEDILEEFFNKQGIKYERKTSKEVDYRVKYMDYKPFYYEDHEEICDFFGKEIESATKLIYEKNFIVKLYNMNRNSEIVDDGSGLPDFKTNLYFFTMLIPIGNREIEDDSEFYIVRQFSFNIDGDLVNSKKTNYRKIKELQISKVDVNLDLKKIKKFLSDPHYTIYIEEANEKEISK